MTATASVTIARRDYLPTYTLAVDLPPTPEGRSRCKHLMLDGECAWCLGHDCEVPE